jgi:hypothetical protein
MAIILFYTGLAAFLLRPKRCPARILPIVLIVYMLWVFVFASGYLVTDYEIFYYPLAVVVAITIGPGVVLPARFLGRVHRHLPLVLYLVIVLMMGVTVGNRMVDMDCSNPELNSAGTFTFRALSELPPDALIIAGSDGHLFSLMYGIECGIRHPVLGDRIPRRSDMDIVGSRWVLREWFRENIRERYGDNGRLRFNTDHREFAPALRDLVDQNLPYRPVYVDGDTLQLLRGDPLNYDISPAIPLFLIEVKD